MDAPQTSEVAAAFAEFLRRRDADPTLEFEAFCASRPEVADGVREVYENWRRMVARSDQLPATVIGDAQASAWRELMARLALHAVKPDRYDVIDALDVGGMGKIFEVWDPALRRRLAMKVIRERAGGIDERMLGRFLEEAQVTAQLDHPGIVPVHELAIAADGRVYFTMKLVRGKDLRGVFEDIRRGDEEWTLTRGLSVLLRVCEALAFAHDRGVVHRDLKPANIMVGRFGETYVMDWGLARVQRGEPVTTSLVDSASRVHTDRQQIGQEKPSLTVLTQDGDFVGTPMYTAPEQAMSADQVDARADCYAVGAILYELLVGEPPFQRPPTGDALEVRRRVLTGPPVPVVELAPKTPAPLIALCERALQRDVAQRYQSMQELAADLRAFLENRVVKAYRSGPFVEFRLWVVRNRGVAAALFALLLILLGATVAVAVAQNRKNRELRLAGDLQLARALVEQPDGLAIRPENAAAMHAWLQRALALRETLAEYRAEYDDLRRRFPPAEQEAGSAQLARQSIDTLTRKLGDAEGVCAKRNAIVADASASSEERQRAARSLEILAVEMQRWRRDLAALQARPAFPDLQLPTAVEQVRCRQLVALLRTAEELFAPERGAVARVRDALQQAALIESMSIGEEPVAARWRHAIASIANRDECPAYRGLRICPQLGLVPIGRSPQGLWEFWHVLSGTEPHVSADGTVELDADSGLVLVLIPGGRGTMGSQKTDPARPNYDQVAEAREQPAHAIEIDPFFLSKYETTQSQWLRATGENPSELYAGSDWRAGGGAPALTVSLLHPVERVTWWECQRMLRRWDLVFPTEGEFEWAQRAGTSGPYWFAVEAVATAANAYGGQDGYLGHAPVDSFAPNPFGLYCIAGNVMEWCEDWYADSYEGQPPRRGSVPLRARLESKKAVRSGSFRNAVAGLRSAYRLGYYPDTQDKAIGFRPARRLQ